MRKLKLVTNVFENIVKDIRNKHDKELEERKRQAYIQKKWWNHKENIIKTIKNKSKGNDKKYFWDFKTYGEIFD